MQKFVALSHRVSIIEISNIWRRWILASNHLFGCGSVVDQHAFSRFDHVLELVATADSHQIATHQIESIRAGIWCKETSREETRSSADADNRLDAFSGQSRSTNMVPFHMLHIVCYCAIVTLSLRHYDIRLPKISCPWNGVKGHSRHWEWYHSIDCMVSY